MSAARLAPDAVVPPGILKKAAALGRLHALHGAAAPAQERSLELLAAAALVEGYRGDPNGLRTALAWAWVDAELGQERWRQWAAGKVKCAVRPLIERRAMSSDIMTAARRENIDPAGRHPLSEGELRSLVEAEMAAVLHGRHWERRYGRR